MGMAAHLHVAAFGRHYAFGDGQGTGLGDLGERGDQNGHSVCGVERGVDVSTTGIDESRTRKVGTLDAVGCLDVHQLSLGDVDYDRTGVGVPREVGSRLDRDAGHDRP